MTKKNVIHWFRQDLRLSDNPALTEASNSGNVIPIYILDDINPGEFKMGAASRWWLNYSLESLNNSLDKKLNLYVGNPEDILIKLIKYYEVSSVYWNRCYEPWRINRDKKIKDLLRSKNIDVISENSSLLWEPWQVNKKDQTSYKVFTPFYQRGCLEALAPREPLKKPKDFTLIKDSSFSKKLKDLKLTPNIPWDNTMIKTWCVGEKAGIKRLKDFISSGIEDYKEGRNFPAKKNVSRLSPHFHFGEVSPNQAWYKAKESSKNDENLKVFLSELGWREFSYNLLYNYPDLPRKNWRATFDKFRWVKNKKFLNAWQQGQTGYPIVDAGMRELWQTGYMHNRVRMIVASFLVKNLLINWREGEKWFWDCLVDADLASNSASWQWVAGCGADAAPYFRIFNPVLQGKRFDKEGEYTRFYVPELEHLPSKYLFSPWEAPLEILEDSGIILGKTYPKPIVDIKISRERALAAYNQTRNN